MSIKSGFVALVGQPNAGKSTLLNALLDEKVSIVSSVAQTTRHMIRGILNHPDYQIVFIDTPGIHQPKDEMGKYLNKTSYGALEGVEVIYFVADATRPLNKQERKLIDNLKNYQQESQIYCLINKIDLLNKSELIDIVLRYQEAFDFDEIIPLSALDRDNLDCLLQLTLKHLPEGVAYFDTSEMTDSTLSFKIKEIIREKVLYLTFQEVPHSISIQLDEVINEPDQLSVIATILVEKDSQKMIVVGKQGNMVKKIRELARRDLKQQFNKKVYLELFIRVEKQWRNRLNKLKDLGYTYE